MNGGFIPKGRTSAGTSGCKWTWIATAMFTMSPAEATAKIGVDRLLILYLEEEAKSRLRPMDISPAMPSGVLSGGRPLLAI